MKYEEVIRATIKIIKEYEVRLTIRQIYYLLVSLPYQLFANAIIEKGRILLYGLKPRRCKHKLANKKDHSHSVVKKAGGGIIECKASGQRSTLGF